MLAAHERLLISQALEQHQWHRSKVAVQLGIDRKTPLFEDEALWTGIEFIQISTQTTIGAKTPHLWEIYPDRI